MKPYRLRCTCSLEAVHSASINPPDMILDPWCPEHGKDPDAELERYREDKEIYEKEDYNGYEC